MFLVLGAALAQSGLSLTVAPDGRSLRIANPTESAVVLDWAQSTVSAGDREGLEPLDAYAGAHRLDLTPIGPNDTVTLRTTGWDGAPGWTASGRAALRVAYRTAEDDASPEFLRAVWYGSPAAIDASHAVAPALSPCVVTNAPEIAAWESRAAPFTKRGKVSTGMVAAGALASLVSAGGLAFTVDDIDDLSRGETLAVGTLGVGGLVTGAIGSLRLRELNRERNTAVGPRPAAKCS